jgi:uncharacterized damage-inducible protein DinB
MCFGLPFPVRLRYLWIADNFMKALTILAPALALAGSIFAADLSVLFAKHWQTSKELTLAVAQAMPAADYNFRPNDEEMSFGKVMTHIAQNNIRAFATVSGLKPLETPAKLAAAFADAKGGVFDKESTIQFLRDSFDYCAKALPEITEAKADAMFGPVTGLERLWSCFTHTAHHRGQAEVYLRLEEHKTAGL